MQNVKPGPAEVLLFCLAILPAFLLGLLLLNYSVDVQYWDQWEAAIFFEKIAQGAFPLREMFAQQNEFRQLFPHFIIVAVGLLTNWDVRFEILVIFLLACLISFNVYRLGKLTAGGSQRRRLRLYFLANLLIFSPVQYESWLQGIQIVYFMPVACLTTCILVAYSGLSTRFKFIGCLCLATVSTFSSVNGVLCWVLALPALVWSPSKSEMYRKRWWVVGWTGGFILNVAAYLHDYHKPPFHLDLQQALFNLPHAIIFFLGALGKPLVISRLTLATIVGITLVVLYIFGWLYLRRNLGDANLVRGMLGWLMIGAYSVLTAAMITGGRLGLGMKHSLDSRYTTFSLYLVISLVYLIPIILDHRPGKGDFRNKAAISRHIYPLLAVYICSCLLVFALGVRQMSMSQADVLHRKACLLLINTLPAGELPRSVYPDVGVLKHRANMLDKLGYLRPGLINSNRVQDFVRMDEEDSRGYGSFDGLTSADDGLYIATGWASLPGSGRPADAVLLAYETDDANSFVFSVAAIKVEKDFVKYALSTLRGDRHANLNWQGSVSKCRLPPRPGRITAWSFDANTGEAYKLAGEHMIPAEAPEPAAQDSP